MNIILTNIVTLTPIDFFFFSFFFLFYKIISNKSFMFNSALKDCDFVNKKCHFKLMLHLFPQKMFFVVKYFQRIIFPSENSFRRLACTKNSPNGKKCW